MPSSTSDFEAYSRNRYFGSLDGLRCLSIIWVIGFHAKLGNTALFRRGDCGVSLFFVISGFLITTLLLREKASRGSISLKKFYARRTLRIFPLYYAAILLYAALVIAVEHGPDRAAFFHHLPFFLTYTNNWFVDRFAGEHVIFAFCWSLATEEQFYLVWPSILRFTRSKRGPLIAIAGALILSITANLLQATGHLPLGETGNRIATSIAIPICLGCALAYALDSRRTFQMIRGLLGNVFSAPAALILLAAIYAMLMRAPADSMLERGLAVPFTAAMLLLVGACCIREDNGIAWLMANPVVRYVGTISYGMYLLHMLGINAAKKLELPHDWRYFAISLALSIGLASASYWLYERQFLKLKHRFSTRTEAEPAKPDQDRTPSEGGLIDSAAFSGPTPQAA
jgi:peptidoglycan/LPS O-acetylase OafA/YrhL